MKNKEGWKKEDKKQEKDERGKEEKMQEKEKRGIKSKRKRKGGWLGAGCLRRDPPGSKAAESHVSVC